MQILQKTCLFFTIVGALNWGLIGFLDFNLVTAIFGDTTLASIIYMIVGISSLVAITILFEDFYERHDDMKKVASN